MQDILDFVKRYDTLFAFLGTLPVAILAYSDRLPLWAVIACVVVGQLFSFIAMKNGRSHV